MSALKMTGEHFAELQRLVNEGSRKVPPVSEYIAAGMTERRHHYDALRAAGWLTFCCRTLYQYLNDSHIDSALKRIKVRS